MHIMYVDDSGTPSLKDDTSYYVISGVIMHIQDLHITGEKFANFNQQWFVYVSFQRYIFFTVVFLCLMALFRGFPLLLLQLIGH